MNVATGRIAPARRGDGPGKTGQIVIWKDGAARQVEYRWGLRPGEPGRRPFSLLRAEGRPIDNPCLIIANDFMVQTDTASGKKRHRHVRLLKVCY